ncbi:hypothetical protein GQ55_3G314700 [Panicum hallii var. hallii]|uniref:AAA+ ATPase domain-containing protein n=1 Tax=Panicum hallii var. hallii TaxID=1504633 RepID=A0A2T7EF92_9POAL|nr:hypothetical protein GQ55_3G314700 [Panicum hallii var. hallii]
MAEPRPAGAVLCPSDANSPLAGSRLVEPEGGRAGKNSARAGGGGKRLAGMEASGVGGQAMDAYRKALATAASAAAYAVIARGMARELLPPELRAAARWVLSALSTRLDVGGRERRTLAGGVGGREENILFDATRMYLASRLDPRAMRRLGLTLARARDGDGRAGWRRVLFLEPGDSTVDVFEGDRFSWACIEAPSGGGGKKKARKGEPGTGGDRDFVLELSFDTDVAMDRYVPFVMGAAEEVEQRDRELKICMNEGRAWYRVSHHHPATFDTLAMDPALKRSIVADLDLFASRRDHYRRIGKAWKRGYLLYGPPGTGKSSLAAAMANHLRYDLFDLDLDLNLSFSHVNMNNSLQWLLVGMSNRSILVIEDIDCCCDAMSREDDKTPACTGDTAGVDDIGNGTALDSDAPLPPANSKSKKDQGSNSRLKSDPMEGRLESQLIPFLPPESGLLNFIDGLWSTSGEERIIIFTTDYKDRLDPALLRPGRMDMHVYMGYCGWEAFRTLARNYFLVDDHELFPEIQALLAEVEVTPAAVSEKLLLSDDAGVALRGLKEFLEEKQQQQAVPEAKQSEEEAEAGKA